MAAAAATTGLAAGGAAKGMMGSMGSSLMGGLASGLGGSLMSGLFGLGGSAKAYKRQKKLFKYQSREGPRLSVEGLRKAGLNPILALQSGGMGSGGNVPSVAQTHALPAPDVAKATKTTAEASLVKQAMQQQIATARQQMHMATAQTDLYDAQAANETLKYEAWDNLPPAIRTQLEATRAGGFWGWIQSMMGQGYENWSAKDVEADNQLRERLRQAREQRKKETLRGPRKDGGW